MVIHFHIETNWFPSFYSFQSGSIECVLIVYFFVFVSNVGKTAPKMDLMRKHLMIEGHIDKECLVKILEEVTDVYRKYSASCYLTSECILNA